MTKSSSDTLAAAVASKAQLSFKRSPQCTASWLSVIAEHPVTVERDVQTLIIPDSKISVFDIIDSKAGAPAGVTLTGPITTLFTDSPFTYSHDKYDACCGVCSVGFAAVNVKYWPVSSSVTDCLRSIDPYYSTFTDGFNPGQFDTRPASNTRNIPIPYPTLAPRTLISMNNASRLSYAVGSDGFI